MGDPILTFFTTQTFQTFQTSLLSSQTLQGDPTFGFKVIENRYPINDSNRFVLTWGSEYDTLITGHRYGQNRVVRKDTRDMITNKEGIKNFEERMIERYRTAPIIKENFYRLIEVFRKETVSSEPFDWVHFIHLYDTIINGIKKETR